MQPHSTQWKRLRACTTLPNFILSQDLLEDRLMTSLYWRFFFIFIYQLDIQINAALNFSKVTPPIKFDDKFIKPLKIIHYSVWKGSQCQEPGWGFTSVRQKPFSCIFIMVQNKIFFSTVSSQNMGRKASLFQFNGQEIIQERLDLHHIGCTWR